LKQAFRLEFILSKKEDFFSEISLSGDKHLVYPLGEIIRLELNKMKKLEKTNHFLSSSVKGVLLSSLDPFGVSLKKCDSTPYRLLSSDLLKN